jgi:hypothetical protein
MTPLINMYVFYDEKGNIKAITPSLNDFSDETCSVTTFPLAEVEEFLLGKRNTSNYEVKKIKTFTGEKFILNKKIVEIVYTRTLDNYLTEVKNVVSSSTIISITNFKSSKMITVNVTENFRLLYKNRAYEDKDIIDDILRYNSTSIHFTEKHNPYYLWFSITFSPQELFEKGHLDFRYTDTIENASVYTKRIITEYSYVERS